MTRDYRGYVIKKESRNTGYGMHYSVYHNGELISICDREKIAEKTVDWLIEYKGLQNDY